jgi:hypothetical protein
MPDHSAQTHDITITITTQLTVVGTSDHIAARVAEYTEEMRQRAQASYGNCKLSARSHEAISSPRKELDQGTFEYVTTETVHDGQPLVHCHVRMAEGGRAVPSYDHESMSGPMWDMRIADIMGDIGAVKDEARMPLGFDAWELPCSSRHGAYHLFQPYADIIAARDPDWQSRAQEADMAFDDSRRSIDE